VEFIGNLNWVDFAVIVALAGGAFAGFQQGLIRYVVSWVVLVIAFIIAAQLKGPLTSLLSNFWTAFDPPVREFWVFVVLFLGLAVGGWFIVRALLRTTRLTAIKQLDEIGGALLGIAFAATFIVLQLVVLDSLYKNIPGQETSANQQTGPLGAYYQALNDSVLVAVFRTTVIPVAGTLARPFVPSDVAKFLRL
jgi:uncharacterized membrane protein required for colicin V production